MTIRGIRNNNPFNIRRSLNSWRGKIKHSSDPDFEQFTTIVYGIRAGIQLLLNGYLRSGYKTVPQIINKYAPSSENNTSGYIDYIYQNSPLRPTTIITPDSLSFFHLCHCICMYESKYDLTFSIFSQVVNQFHLFPFSHEKEDHRSNP